MTTLLVFLFSMGSTLPFHQNNKKPPDLVGSFDDTSKIRRALEKNTPVVLDDSGMQSISAKKPEATGWHHPGNAPNLSPYGFASLPFDKFAKKLPNIFKD